jgi:hypothetical protein
LLAKTALMGVVGSIVMLNLRPSAMAQMVVLKQGQLQALPILQTRARVPVQPVELLYIGMLEERFLNYAIVNNWQTISVSQEEPRLIRWQLLPGGEAVYPPINPISAVSALQIPAAHGLPVYARGFVVQAYFQSGRLVGMNLVRDPDEDGFDLNQLKSLIHAWFPDNQVTVRYQVLPEDPSQQIITAHLGDIPPEFVADLTRTEVPFCQILLSPFSVASPPSAPLERSAQCFPLRDAHHPHQLNPELFGDVSPLSGYAPVNHVGWSLPQPESL